MLDWDIDEYDFASLLAATPATKGEVQMFVKHGYGISVPRSNYEAIVDRLVRDLGEIAAARAICEIVVTTAKPRLLSLIELSAKGKEIELRYNEAKIVDLVFYGDGSPTMEGEVVVKHWKASQRKKRKSKVERDSSPSSAYVEQPAPVSIKPTFSLQTHVKFPDLDPNMASVSPNSAETGEGWRLEPVQASTATFLKSKTNWLEVDLEDYLIANWNRIDFGLGYPIKLVGRQVSLKGTREKVDLLAVGPNDSWIAIELKIVTASGRDFTQLQSYVADLLFQGIAKSKVFGLLVAPGFEEKVLNAAALHPNITLLRFLSG